MKNLIKKQSILLAFALVHILANAQTTKSIDYTASSLSSSACNVFNPSIYVNTILHQSYAGGVTFNSSNGILLSTIPSGSSKAGTAFVIQYNFIPGNKYDIAITAKGNSSMYLNTSVIPDFNQFTTSSTTACTPDGLVSGYQLAGYGKLSTATSQTSTIYNVPQFNISGSNVYQYLIIWANGGLITSSLDVLAISKIEITETATPSFTLTPNTVPITCGQNISQTFTVNNLNSTPGVTSYIWNLGANNGWLYNGSAANATITTATNTLNLTSTSCVGVSNISATAVIGSTNYNTNTSTITNVLPTFTIDGLSSFCSGTQNYTVANVPCTATVTWAVTPTGISTTPTSGNPTSLSQVGNGAVTLTATIANACGVNSTTVQKLISIGGAATPGPISFPLIDQASGRIQASIDDVPGATSYKWYKNGVLVSTYTGTFAQIPISKTQCNVTYDISVSATNSCGTSAQTHANAYVPCSGGFAAYTISPNPASSSLNIASTSTTPSSNTTTTSLQSSANRSTGVSTSNDNAIDEIRIYTMQGILKKSFKINKATVVSLNIASLENGNYLVEIIAGSNKETQRLLVQR